MSITLQNTSFSDFDSEDKHLLWEEVTSKSVKLYFEQEGGVLLQNVIVIVSVIAVADAATSDRRGIRGLQDEESAGILSGTIVAPGDDFSGDKAIIIFSFSMTFSSDKTDSIVNTPDSLIIPYFENESYYIEHLRQSKPFASVSGIESVKGGETALLSINQYNTHVKSVVMVITPTIPNSILQSTLYDAITKQVESYYGQKKWAAAFNVKVLTLGSTDRMLEINAHRVLEDRFELEYEQYISYNTLFEETDLNPYDLIMEPFIDIDDQEEFFMKLGPQFLTHTIKYVGSGDNNSVLGIKKNDETTIFSSENVFVISGSLVVLLVLLSISVLIFVKVKGMKSKRRSEGGDNTEDTTVTMNSFRLRQKMRALDLDADGLGYTPSENGLNPEGFVPTRDNYIGSSVNVSRRMNGIVEEDTVTNATSSSEYNVEYDSDSLLMRGVEDKMPEKILTKKKYISQDSKLYNDRRVAWKDEASNDLNLD